MTLTTTLVGWAIIIALGVTAYNFYFKKPAKAVASKIIVKAVERRKEPKKARKARKDDGSSGDQEKSAYKKNEDYTMVAKDIDIADEEIDNREFARQLSSAKAGTLMAAKAQEGARQRSIKQSRAQEKPVIAETSSDNGTAGADADDDRSSLNSPELGATTMSSLVGNGDVSDMLEARVPGPSVLRVTAPTVPTVSKKAKPAAVFETIETKKQRQNRKKAEAKKLAREEEEKERKIILEKQRRTAREAEGRAAKDGSSFMAAQAPTSSAWTATSTTVNGNKDVKTVDLLDTYNPSNTKPPPSQETHQSEIDLTGSDWQKVVSGMSEEEQIKRALADSGDWKTVSKEKRSRKKIQPVLSNQMEDKQSSNDEQNDYGVPPLIPPTGAGQRWNMTLVSEKPNGEFEERETEVQDSEWEVA